MHVWETNHPQFFKALFQIKYKPPVQHTDRSLVEAAMPVASAEEVERFALVMVHPTREEDGSLTHILHTLLPEERPTEVRSSCNPADSSGDSHAWTAPTQ